MRKAVCSGSFDPVTKGHIDIIELKAATSHLPNVRVTSCSGLLNEFCEKEQASFIVRGLRAFTDFEYEFQRALLLKKINESLETVFIMTNANYSYISSSGVRELLAFDGDINQLVPTGVAELINKYQKRKTK